MEIFTGICVKKLIGIQPFLRTFDDRSDNVESFEDWDRLWHRQSSDKRRWPCLNWQCRDTNFLYFIFTEELIARS